jgi:ATP-binding cassette subfamily F protein uup
MSLLQLRQITLKYSSAPLLDRIDFQVEAAERICLLGRNGAGKTSLMRIITGEETPNEGELILPSEAVVTRLIQEIPDDITGTVMEVLHSGLRPDRHEEEWQTDVRLEDLMAEMHLPADHEFSALSGGLKRRVLLARALAGQPDILLLDEPTNHLDLDSILWLERFLLESKMTLFFVTHDRAFLRKLATRIVELDRGQLTSWACDYDTYLERKAADLEAEEKQWAAFDKKLAQEEAWLRMGVKARRTRNEGRVRALQKMRTERGERRQREGTARIELQTGGMSGQKVIEAKEISFDYGAAPIVRDFTTTIWRGDKIGIIGPNGGGKTTLLKLLLGQLAPESGTVKLGTNLQVVYLDQLRGQIDNAKTVAQNVAGDAETVTFQGRPRHIHSYLQDFLFRADRIRMPAKMLSGGERNRLLLARLFLQPANVLVMDEPTNDLDAETLELLEELLLEYTGTLLLVSHDRVFLDNVVTSTLVFEGEGRITEYTGGYEDWIRQRAAKPVHFREILAEPKPEAKPAPAAPLGKAPKFLNREQRELEELPALLEKMEADLNALNEKMWDPELYKKEPGKLPILKTELAVLEERIKHGYTRWEQLEAKRKASEAEGRYQTRLPA